MLKEIAAERLCGKKYGVSGWQLHRPVLRTSGVAGKSRLANSQSHPTATGFEPAKAGFVIVAANLFAK
jgi:hypothetical protein